MDPPPSPFAWCKLGISNPELKKHLRRWRSMDDIIPGCMFIQEITSEVSCNVGLHINGSPASPQRVCDFEFTQSHQSCSTIKTTKLSGMTSLLLITLFKLLLSSKKAYIVSHYSNECGKRGAVKNKSLNPKVFSPLFFIAFAEHQARI